MSARIIGLLNDPPPTSLPEPHPQEWKLHAIGACRKSGYAGFIDTRDRAAVKAAKATCQACPVFDVCRDVIDHIEGGCVADNQMAGVWAGETPNARAVRRRAERKLAQAS